MNIGLTWDEARFQHYHAFWYVIRALRRTAMEAVLPGQTGPWCTLTRAAFHEWLCMHISHLASSIESKIYQGGGPVLAPRKVPRSGLRTYSRASPILSSRGLAERAGHDGSRGRVTGTGTHRR